MPANSQLGTGFFLLKRQFLSTVWTLVGIQPSTCWSAPMLEFDWIASTMHPIKPTAMALAAPCAVSMVILGTGSLPTNLRAYDIGTRHRNEALEVHHSVSPKTPVSLCIRMLLERTAIQTSYVMNLVKYRL